MSLLASLDLRPTQLQAAQAAGHDVSLAAGAGSGKTRTLVARYLALLDGGLLPRQVVAVTFTEKAAREMRNRIRASASAWLAGGCPPEDRARWTDIEADVDAARISTIHGLCAALLRAHPAEAGVDPRFDVLDEGLAASLRAAAVRDALDWVIAQPDLAPLFTAFRVRDLQAILQRLLSARLEAGAALAVDATASWPALIESAIRQFTSQAKVGFAITDLRAMAEDGSLLFDAGDKLHSQVLELLAAWQAMETALAEGRSVDAAVALFTVRKPHSKGGAGKNGRARAAVKFLRENYNAMVDRWLGGAESADEPPDADLEASLAALLPMLGRLFERARQGYHDAKDLRQALDFDDLEAGAVALLARPAVRARWQEQVQALLVDEFQDTNERQRQIVEAIAGVADGLSGRLFVVGDARQSIYRFRGADVDVFRRLAADITARGGLALSLDETFRAHASLLAALDELLINVHDAVDGDAAEHVVAYSRLVAMRSEPRAGCLPPHIEFICGLDEDGGSKAGTARPAGAHGLARRLRALHDAGEIKWDDVALLFRATGAVPVYEAALEEAGIPFVTVAGRGFYGRPEIRDLLNMLRALADPWDDLAMAGFLRSPAIALSDASLYRLRWPQPGGEPRSFRQALAGDLSAWPEPERQAAKRAHGLIERLSGLVDRVPVAQLLKRLLEETLYPALLAAGDAGARPQRNVDKLLADAHASGLVGVGEFLEYIETLQAAGAREGEAPAEAGGSLRLMTVHKAKGLEFPVVVLADATRGRPAISPPVLLSSTAGLLPKPSGQEAPLVYRLARGQDQAREAAEDLRVLYVAATRAREKLIICGHLPGKTSDVWLMRLAAAAGLDPNQLAAEPDVPHSRSLPASGQAVSFIACMPDAAASDATPSDSTAPAAVDEPTASASLTPLYQPLPPPPNPADYASFQPPASSFRSDSDDEIHDAESIPHDRPFAIWSARRRAHADVTLVGSLVHAALARWCFPGDPALPALLRAKSLEQGHPGDTEQTATADARRLLARLRADPRWPALDAAERRHEMPYSLPGAHGRATGGIIDLLYCLPGETAWRLVDFKTDSVAGRAGPTAASLAAHQAQLQAYRNAVAALLGLPGSLELCYLDWDGQVRWVGLA